MLIANKQKWQWYTWKNIPSVNSLKHIKYNSQNKTVQDK
jgi:hypothetical protein